MSIYDKASLVLIPSGSKTSKVYSQKPTNGDGDFTFSRSTAATRVNASGNIEKETQNLLVQSNQFDTTWTTSNTSVASGHTGYDGSSDAWLLSKSAASGLIKQNYNTSGVYTYSVYAKAGSSNWMQLHSNARFAQYFDLQNGVVGTFHGAIITAKIEDIGNGWYRCSVIDNGSNAGELRIYPAEGQDDVSGTSGSIYIQDAQLEQGLVARDYIETTTTAIYGGITDNVPKLDYQGSCPALLLEPQRTNLYQHSEYIFNFQGTETFNAAVSPEGVSNAVLLTKTSTSDQFVNMSWSGSSLSPSTDYTMSFFVKHNGDDVDVRYEYNNSNDWGKGWYALFQVRASGVTASTTNLCTSDVKDYGNGWYRILVFVETASSITPSSPSNLLRVIGASGDDVLVYGAGMEQGSYATSYIPTYGSAVTRNADSTDDLDTSSLLTQSNNNTFFGEVVNHRNTGNTRFIASYDSARSNNDRILIYTGNLSNNYILHCQYKVSGQPAVAMDIKTSINYGDTIKFAVVFNGTQMIGFANGVKTATATIVDADNFNKFDITDVVNEGGVYKQLIVFPTALTDQEAIDLTTI